MGRDCENCEAVEGRQMRTNADTRGATAKTAKRSGMAQMGHSRGNYEKSETVWGNCETAKRSGVRVCPKGFAFEGR